MKKQLLILIGLALSASVSVAQLNGSYDVPGKFNSLTNAGGIFEALNTQGAFGNITINITADLAAETGAVALNELAGGHKVTIKPSGAPRTITPATTAGVLIKLNGADNVTIDGSLAGGTDRSLTMICNANGTAIQIAGATASNGANANTVKNCILSGNAGSSGDGGILATSSGAPNSNNTVRDNQIFRVRDGMFISGNAAAPDRNWVITGNSLGSTATADEVIEVGIFMRHSQDFIISDNIINGLSSSAAAVNTGIWISQVINGGFISGNKISDVKNTNASGGSNGIYLAPSSTASNVTIFNNFIWDIAAVGSAGTSASNNGYGIMIESGGGYKIYYNSVNLATNQTVAGSITAAVNIASAVTTAGAIDLRDNIFVNSETVGTRYAIYNNSPAGAALFSSINYNDYFAQNVGFQGSARATLANWQTATGQDADSLSVNPSFISGADLHLTIDSPVIGRATPISNVLVDLDSEIWDTTAPDMVADEVTAPCASTFSENFDAVTAPALPAGWSTVATGVELPWVTSTTNPASSPNEAFAPEVFDISTTELITPVIAAPAGGSTLTFLNLFNLEFEDTDTTTGYDGMVLEISINGGAFADIITAGGSFVTGGYTRKISGDFMSPITGRNAWSGLSAGTTQVPSYFTTTANLPAIANGQNIQLKWQVACDNSNIADGPPGVRIDNVAIIPATCAPLAATHFEISAPASGTAGSPFTFTVTALGQSNGIATGYAGTVHFTSTDPQAVLPADSTLTNGVGTFSATLKTAGNQTISAVDTSTSSITGVSGNVAVSPAGATHYTMSTPGSATANSSFSFTLTAQDQFNNTATGYTGTVHFTSTDGMAILPADSTLTSGVGTFSATLMTAGNQTITATDTIISPITGTSPTIAISTAPTPTPTATPAPTPTPTATPTPTTTPTPSPTPTTLANISTRLRVETGDNALIGGFIITGTQPKKVLLRGIGPSLPVAGALANPILELNDGAGALLEANDNWMDSPNKQAIIDSTIPPKNDLESAIVATLPANNSRYTAIVRGVNNGTGIGLVEAYDLDRTVDSKLANISTRGLVQTDNNVLIAGTIVVGQASQKVLIRAIGPSLPVAGKLEDPTLELRDGNGVLLEANDNWIDSPNKQAIIDSTIPPTNDLESAIVRTLPANGATYTAIVRGVNNTTGIGLVEVYALP